MRLLLLPLLALALSACSENATPLELHCPATAQTAHFAVSAGCGLAGHIVVTSTDGLCAIQVQNAYALGLPQTGHFSGQASATHYDLTKGNWEMHRGSSDPGADPSSLTCSAAPAATGGGLALECSFNDCIPAGDQDTYQCSQSTCTDYLTVE